MTKRDALSSDYPGASLALKGIQMDALSNRVKRAEIPPTAASPLEYLSKEDIAMGYSREVAKIPDPRVLR